MFNTKSSRAWHVNLIAVVCLMAILFSCAPASPASVQTQTSPVPAQASAAAPTQASAAPPTQTPEIAHLLSWRIGVGPGNDAWSGDFVKYYNSSHPGVDLEFDPALAGLNYQTAGMQKLRLAWQNKSGPDFQGDVEGTIIHDFVNNGLLTDLTPAYQKYGWNNDMPPKLVGFGTVNGKQYAVPTAITAIGVFYNKDIYAKLGLSIPTTYDQFLANMDAIKKAGYYPLEMGLSQGWPAEFITSEFGFSTNGEEYIQVLQAKQKWTESPATRTAVGAFNDLVVKGYFNPDPLGIDYNQGDALFFQGKAAMTWNGYWLIGSWMQAGKPFNIGFFPMPPVTSDAKPLVYGGGGALVVSANSKYPQAVLDYLNWYFSPDTAIKVLRDTSAIVPVPFTVPYDLPSITKEFTQYTLDHEADLAGYENDYMPPALVTTLSQSIQGMVGGTLTVDQVLAAMQQAREAYDKQAGN